MALTTISLDVVPASLKAYDIAGSTIGKPANAATIARFVAVRAFTLPASLTGSYAKAGAAATASAAFILNKNGTQIGDFTYGIGSANGGFTFASQVAFAAGDVLTVVGPSTADTTLSDIQFTLAGVLV
jgi:hypothetical protein